MQRLRALLGLSWAYPRRATTAAVLVVACAGTLLARALLPHAWRPPGVGAVLLASAASYAALRVDAHKGWSKRFKHAVLDWFGGDVDDVQTWLLAALAGGATLALLAALHRVLA